MLHNSASVPEIWVSFRHSSTISGPEALLRNLKYEMIGFWEGCWSTGAPAGRARSYMLCHGEGKGEALAEVAATDTLT
jgi:hypothetical protein